MKNYRPKLLVLSGDPSERPCLVDFSNLLTKRLSLLQFTNVVLESPEEDAGTTTSSAAAVAPQRQAGQDWLDRNHVKAFYAVTRNRTLARGAQNAVELSGLGKLSPNMMMLGFR